MRPLPDAPSDVAASGRRRWARVAALVAVTAALVVGARTTGLGAHLHAEEIRASIAAAGVWGPVAYLVVFSIGELVHIPGAVFVAAAVIAYGRAFGCGLAFIGALVSLSVSFAVVRGVGGQPLEAVRWRFLRRMLDHLEDHPIRTIALLRLVLWMTPQLNYALALSSVRFRSYLIGSALGLVAPIIVLSLAFDRFLR